MYSLLRRIDAGGSADIVESYLTFIAAHLQ